MVQPVRILRLRRVAVVVACLLSAAAFAQDVKPLDRPLSPGAVALLIAGNVGSPELTRWAEALADPRPDVRAAAARVAFVSGASPLVPALLKAVERETDRAAAREEFVALGQLAPGEADDALFAAARRFEGALNEELARALGRRGPAALALAPRLRDLPLEGSHWQDLFVWSTREGRQSLAEAANAALATGQRRPWADLLAMVRAVDRDLADSVLARAVRSDSSPVRAATYWHLLRLREGDDEPGPETRRALEASPEARGEGGDPVAALSFELLGRALGRPGQDRTALIEGLSGEEVAFLPTDAAALGELEKPERAAWGQVRFGNRKSVDETLDKAKWQEAARKRARRGTRVRTISDFPPDLTSDVLAVTGCEVEKLQQIWVGLQASYDADGALQEIGVFSMEGLSPACQTAARVLLLMGFRPFDRPPRPGETDVLALPLVEAFFSCAAEPDPPVVRFGLDKDAGVGRITPPKRITSLQPTYPSSARNEHREGTVVLEAVIGPSGCVRSVEVVHGPAPDLDGAAMRAVAFWRYTPTLLNGKPVPVVMTVTVNFRLR
jgi:TonB family protein